MRLHDLFEAPDRARQRQSDPLRNQTQTTDRPELDIPFQGDNAETQVSAPNRGQVNAGRTPIPGRTASSDRTRRAASNIQMTPQAQNTLNAIHASGATSTISDDEARRDAGVTDGEAEPVPKTPGTQVAKISRDVANVNATEPEWHAVKNLPGYLQNPIRAMGQMVFSPLTNTKISEINVIANLQGQGPNPQAELDYVTNTLRQQAEPSSIINYSAEQLEQLMGVSYEAKAIQFDTDDTTYLCVKDFMGNYIYSWPTADSKPSPFKKQQPALGVDRARLGSPTPNQPTRQPAPTAPQRPALGSPKPAKRALP